MAGQSATVVPTQLGSFVSAPAELQQTLSNQPVDAIAGIAGKYTSNFGVRETVPLPDQQLTAAINVAEKYVPREITPDIPSAVPAQVSQVAGSVPTPYSVTRSQDGEADGDADTGYGYAYYTRQVSDSQSQTSASVQNPVNQVAGAVTNQTGNIDPIALTQCVYRALEQNFGRMGPILYDLITSNEGLGQDFAPITAYAAQRLGTQNIRNAVDTVVNIANQVDWRSRAQSLFNRIGDLRDNQTGLTLQEAFQVVRNVFDDPRAYDELRQRIQDGAGQTVTAAINVVDGPN